jgi:hypothetical protein
MDPRRIQTQFFSSANEQLLISTVLNDFKQRVGQISEKQETRLERTITHYMDEVWEANGPQPIQTLNREVVGATVNDFTTYLRRSQDQPTMAAAVNQVVNMPQRPSYQEMEQPKLQLTMDTGDRFEQIQKERTMIQNKAPKVPDFRISLEETSTLSPLEQFELAKKAREAEAGRVSGMIGSAPRIEQQIPQQSDPNGNPTLSLAGTYDNKPSLPQDILIKQESVVSYKEVEDNLFVWSADRDWVNNTTQSRYNFTINFDTANNRHGFGLGAAVTKKFKNIVRIELIKAILPVEGLESVMQLKTFTNGTFAIEADTGLQVNALSFPFVTLRIPELDGNNYGSDNYLDNAFGVLQYDANWNTDNYSLVDGRGFIAMIPKFLKSQKVYQPTPLATLTKLTFQIQRPTGAYLSDISDSFRVYGIYPDVVNPATSISATFTYSGTNLVDTGVGATGNSLFYLVRTYECFNRFTFTKGDRVVFAGLDSSVMVSGANALAVADLMAWIQDPNGHILVDIAFISDGESSVLSTGYNAAGYANILIIQAPFLNPASNALANTTYNIPPVKPFGGSTTNNKTLETPLATTVFLKGRVLNLSHQTHLVLRIITRELDPMSRVRPDNM